MLLNFSKLSVHPLFYSFVQNAYLCDAGNFYGCVSCKLKEIKSNEKILLTVIFFATVLATLDAQVTQINSNKNLEFVAPIGTNKAVFVSTVDHHLWVSDGITLLLSTINYDETSISIN